MDMKLVDVQQSIPDYGMKIVLDDATMEKLGINERPEIGAEFHIVAVCKVSRVVATDSDCDSVELQITHMGAMEEAEPSPMRKAAKKLYPSAEESEE